MSEWLQKAKECHGDKHDHQQVSYIGSLDKVENVVQQYMRCLQLQVMPSLISCDKVCMAMCICKKLNLIWEWYRQVESCMWR